MGVVLEVPIIQGVSLSSTYTPASIIKRFIAYLIDLLIFYFAFFTPFLSIYAFLSNLPISSEFLKNYILNSQEAYLKLLVAYFGGLFLLLAYFTFFEALLNSTLGKKLLNLKVVSDKSKISFVSAIIRNLSKSVLFFILPYDTLLAIFNPSKKRFFDFLAGTKVVNISSAYKIEE